MSRRFQFSLGSSLEAMFLLTLDFSLILLAVILSPVTFGSAIGKRFGHPRLGAVAGWCLLAWLLLLSFRD